MKELLVAAIVIMVFVVIFQIAKASEYVSVLKGEDVTRKQTNKINGFLLISFLILGLIGVYVCNHWFYGKTLFVQGSASKEGEEIDFMFMLTTAITGFVFIVTQILLFWFSYKYQEDRTKKAHFFAHSNTLELIWTGVPAIVLVILVVFGLINWFKMTGNPPDNAMVVEITGHQFAWEVRYPGKDGIFGKKIYTNYNKPSGNTLGVDFNDVNSLDDIHVPAEMHLIKGVPVKLVIGAQDVIHDVGLNHFRMKMDAVPGIPTTLWFTPQYTTAEMKVRTGNANFVYEISCDQMCGQGHYSMRGTIVVETKEEYDAYMAKQKPEYFALFPDKAPAPMATADTAAKKIVTAALIKK
jgi:cytochrome c oxidase subunit II